ncbi:unnamed protein product [Penicillium crustosum]
MGLSNLPTELVQAIAELLSKKDVLVFAQLNRQFFDILIDYLYARNAKKSNGPRQWSQALSNEPQGRHFSPPSHKRRKSKHGSILLNAGVDVNQQNKYLETPLSAPARDGNEELVKLLLDQLGIDPDVLGRSRIRPPRLWRQTPLLYAAMNGHVDILRLLLATNRVNVESKDVRGWTPLAYAAAHGQAKVMKVLIKVRAIRFGSRAQWDETPLMLAVMNGHEAVTRILIEQESVKDDIKWSYGSTALWFAVLHGHLILSSCSWTKGAILISPATSAIHRCG